MDMVEYAGGKMLGAREGNVGFITFNQPEKRNAMSLEMWEGLGQILDEFIADSDIRAVVLSGAGDKAFVSGADISQFEKHRGDAEARKSYEARISSARDKLKDFPKPVIARIRGYCLGGGLGIAMQADLRIAAEGSQFGIPAARLSIAYAPDSIRRLISLVGAANAKLLLYTARRIDAREAARMGLIHQAVADDALDAEVLAVAKTIAENAPLSVAASKVIIDEMIRDESKRDTEAMKQAMDRCFNSADYKEGRTAFMEKRKPVWQGK